MNLEALSGGGFYLQGIAVASATATIEKGFHPNAIAGVSAGAYVAAVKGMIGANGMLREIKNLDVTKAFKKIPLKKNGKLKPYTWLRVLLGFNYVSVMDGRPMLRNIITPEIYYRYKNSDHTPTIFTLAVNATTGERAFFNLKYDPIDYEEMLKMVEASARIPFMTEAVEIRGQYYWDGGNRDHIPSMKLLDYYKGKIELHKETFGNKLLSIYSRPKDHVSINTSWDKNAFTTLLRSIEIFSIETSKSDERIEKELCDKYGIKRDSIYLPKYLNNYYHSDPSLIKMLMDEAEELALKIQL
jgi:hypothetical protein